MNRPQKLPLPPDCADRHLVSVGSANEIAGYVLAISSSWALAFTLLSRGHIRIDALQRLLSIPARALLDVLSLVSLVAFTSLLIWYGWDVLAASLQFSATWNTLLGTPLWIPQGVWLAGTRTSVPA